MTQFTDVNGLKQKKNKSNILMGLFVHLWKLIYAHIEHVHNSFIYGSKYSENIEFVLLNVTVMNFARIQTDHPKFMAPAKSMNVSLKIESMKCWILFEKRKTFMKIRIIWRKKEKDMMLSSFREGATLNNSQCMSYI